jgi:hypothetical protein
MTTALPRAAGAPPARPAMAERAHLAALLDADVRRLGPSIARSAAGVLGVLVLAAATGVGSRGFVSGLLAALLLMHPLFLAMQVAKDRMDGTLEFLCTLPVTPRTLAAVRLVPILALCGAAGLTFAGLVLWTGATAPLGFGTRAAAGVALLLGTLVPAAGAAALLALAVRMRFEALVRIPMFAIMGLVLLGKLLDRVVPPTAWRALAELARDRGFPAWRSAWRRSALASVIAVAYRLLARALAQFVPDARRA